jgi:hypothetical protein
MGSAHSAMLIYYGEKMNTKTLYVCGMLIPITYIFLYILGGALRPGYSHISNSVSELLSPGAPNKSLLIIIQTIYALLHVFFGYGVLRFIRGTANDLLIGRLGAWMIIALGLATLGTVIFPQDAEGTTASLAGQIHKILVFGGLIPLSILSTLLIGLWLRKADLFTGLDVYSFITVGAIVVMGGVGGATVETPYAGLVERIAALVTQQWLFVLGLRLLLNN